MVETPQAVQEMEQAEARGGYRAVLRHARISPRKARLVADLVRGRSLNQAYDVLRLCGKRTAPMVRKLLYSAQHNALDRNPRIDVDALYVREITVGKGKTLKRFMPRAKGRACEILKRMCHISVTIGERSGEIEGKRRRTRKAKSEAAAPAAETAQPQAANT